MRALIFLVGAAMLTGCTDYARPTGVEPVSSASLRPVAYDETAEARLLTNACAQAEVHGVGALSSLAGKGYSYVAELGDEAYVKRGLPGNGLTHLHQIGVSKPNDRLNCTIRVMPYTHGASVLAIAKDELQRQGWRSIPSQRGSADWFVKDGHTVTVTGWVPGQNRKLITGAEVILSSVAK